MRDDEYSTYLEVLRDTYVADIVGSGLLDRDDAEAKAKADIEEALPEGLRTPKAHLYGVEDDTVTVGYAWMSERPDERGRRLAYVFDIWIREDARRRGFGRAAMVALEDEARALGLDRIRLNVFGQNAGARRLYRSLGYDELSVQMGKTLDRPA
jgi:ribosomal protein S18 acetylase RimI-like enzyme